jgi:sirohydrochlorin ferrochelatase
VEKTGGRHFVRALLLVAHGSRREESNEEVRRLGQVLASYAGDRFHRVSCGFLEYATPGVVDGIGDCVAAGAREVVVLPYFLSAGKHVSEDIPQLVDQARRAHEGVAITLAPYVGSAAGLVQAILSLAE